jgi:hypothetical protein
VRVLLGTAVRLLLILALIAALVAVPLLTVHRAECEGGDPRYRAELPWEEGDSPAGCDFDQNGWEVLREEVGLD